MEGFVDGRESEEVRVNHWVRKCDLRGDVLRKAQKGGLEEGDADEQSIERASGGCCQKVES
jgi:hypothetical protein